MARGARPSARILVVATTNAGKLEELRSLLGDVPFDVRGLRDVVAGPYRVVEDGATFADNALKKARAAAQATGLVSLADDSGLEVDALDGRPGVRSARFAREGASDDENTTALLAALERSGRPAPWPARFRCVLAVADPTDGRTSVAEGVCEGAVTREPAGRGGFGYDPIFVVRGGNRTMAELSHAEKNAVSHRARAAAALREFVRRLA